MPKIKVFLTILEKFSFFFIFCVCSLRPKAYTLLFAMLEAGGKVYSFQRSSSKNAVK